MSEFVVVFCMVIMRMMNGYYVNYTMLVNNVETIVPDYLINENMVNTTQDVMEYSHMNGLLFQGIVCLDDTLAYTTAMNPGCNFIDFMSVIHHKMIRMEGQSINVIFILKKKYTIPYWSINNIIKYLISSPQDIASTIILNKAHYNRIKDVSLQFKLLQIWDFRYMAYYDVDIDLVRHFYQNQIYIMTKAYPSEFPVQLHDAFADHDYALTGEFIDHIYEHFSFKSNLLVSNHISFSLQFQFYFINNTYLRNFNNRRFMDFGFKIGLIPSNRTNATMDAVLMYKYYVSDLICDQHVTEATRISINQTFNIYFAHNTLTIDMGIVSCNINVIIPDNEKYRIIIDILTWNSDQETLQFRQTHILGIKILQFYVQNANKSDFARTESLDSVLLL